MSTEYTDGDLFDPDLRLHSYAHGCNTRGVWGAGIAKTFRDVFPEIYEQYAAICRLSKPKDLIGQAQLSIAPGRDPKAVICLFTQLDPGPHAYPEYIESSLTMMDRLIRDETKIDPKRTRIGLPWIGCGIGGLSRSHVLPIFNKVLAPSPVQYTIVSYKPTPRMA